LQQKRTFFSDLYSARNPVHFKENARLRQDSISRFQEAAHQKMMAAKKKTPPLF